MTDDRAIDIKAENNKTGDTRSRILETTWRLMEKRAGRGVRMSDIAKASGVSRQAIYLHFNNRTELLVATTEYIDEINQVERRIKPTLDALTGRDRLNRFIEFWGSHLPEIYAIAKALLDQLSSDTAAAAAWANRMGLVREQCEAIVQHLKRDQELVSYWDVSVATDMLFATLSVQVWEQHIKSDGWSEQEYVDRMKKITTRILVRE